MIINILYILMGMCWGSLHVYWLWIQEKRISHLEESVSQIFKDQANIITLVENLYKGMEKSDAFDNKMD